MTDNGVTTHRLDKLEKDVSNLKVVVYGPEGKLGVATMVQIMWRTHLFALCGVSGVFGTVVGGVMIYWLTKGVSS